MILNLGKPYGLKDQIYQVVFILIAARYNLGGRSLEFISDNKSRKMIRAFKVQNPAYRY